jgi:hypothetical protein
MGGIYVTMTRQNHQMMDTGWYNDKHQTPAKFINKLNQAGIS